MADYGSDISCVTDVTQSLSEVSGRRALIENISRRLITPARSVFYDPSYGFDVRQFLSGIVVNTGEIASGVLEQVEADERVLTADANVSLIGERLTINVSVVDGGGPFEYSLTIDRVTSTLLLNGVEL